MLRQPKGLVAVTDSPITKEELEEFFEVIEPNWSERIADRAFDRSIDLHTARIRANCFTFQGKKRLGCVIRRFPKEPIALAELGLHRDEQEFARLTSGLVLIIGDTCQGKSTTIASMLDEINKQRSGHIITIEDPVETLIPQRKCIITQREVGLRRRRRELLPGRPRRAARAAGRDRDRRNPRRPDRAGSAGAGRIGAAGAGLAARALDRAGIAEDDPAAGQLRSAVAGAGACLARRAVPGAAAVVRRQPLLPGHRMPDAGAGHDAHARDGQYLGHPRAHEQPPPTPAATR